MLDGGWIENMIISTSNCVNTSRTASCMLVPMKSHHPAGIESILTHHALSFNSDNVEYFDIIAHLVYDRNNSLDLKEDHILLLVCYRQQDQS
jgi:hypothetical protein